MPSKTSGFSDPSESTTSSRRPDAAAKGDSSAREALNDAKDTAAEMADRVIGQAKEAATAVQDRAKTLADQGKVASAERIKGLAGVARDTADNLEDQSPTAARYVREAADGIERVSSSIRNRSIGEIIDVVQNFARGQPVAFFGSTVLAGFVLSRFVKSSSERHGESASSYGNANYSRADSSNNTRSEHKKEFSDGMRKPTRPETGTSSSGGTSPSGSTSSSGGMSSSKGVSSSRDTSS